MLGFHVIMSRGCTLKGGEKMLTGLVICKDEYEVETVLKRLKEVRFAEIKVDGVSISIDYTPSDVESYFEEQECIARLIDIIESVELHGFSLSQ